MKRMCGCDQAKHDIINTLHVQSSVPKIHLFKAKKKSFFSVIYIL